MTYISRDPFAREELHRRLVPTRCGCAECGRVRRRGRAMPPEGGVNPATDRLFKYDIQTDGGRTHPIRGLFCSADCMRAYHGR